MDANEHSRAERFHAFRAIQNTGLINLRIRNAPSRYNPLTDGIPVLPKNLPATEGEQSPRYQWEIASSLIDEALWCLSDGGSLLVDRYKCDWLEWIENDEFDMVKFSRDFPARFHRAFKTVYRGLGCVYQYSARINGHAPLFSPVAAARSLLSPSIDDRITDPQLYILLALAKLAHAIESLQEFASDSSLFAPDIECPVLLISYVGYVREWLDTSQRLDEAEVNKRKDLEAAQSAHEADPDKVRGRKVKQGASEGGLIQSKWPERSEEMQTAINAIHGEKPGLSYEEVKRRASRRHGFPMSALKRYTINPARKT
ncbi:MAG: hypothetical protein B7Y40_05995 [Gammaproteobacteria bacterium 28-57-27]|nr:MAG: hypothetical protein B7Y40_05995 [Gammaproteobacteria bacterium 28-57-27]